MLEQLDFEMETKSRKLIFFMKVAWRCLDAKTDDSLFFLCIGFFCNSKWRPADILDFASTWPQT